MKIFIEIDTTKTDGVEASGDGISSKRGYIEIKAAYEEAVTYVLFSVMEGVINELGADDTVMEILDANNLSIGRVLLTDDPTARVKKVKPEPPASE